MVTKKGKDQIEQYKNLIKRGHMAAALEAKIAAGGGTTKEEYFEYRNAAYMEKAPQDMVLPVKPILENGTVHFVHNPEWENDPVRRALEDPAGEDLLLHAGAAERRWVSQEAQTEARQLLRDIADSEQQAAEAEHALRSAGESVNEAKANLQKGVAEGTILPQETTRQRLAHCPFEEPNVRTLTILSILASIAVVVVEGIQLGLTFADSLGVDVTALASQFKRAPVNVVIAFLLGFAASAAILASAHIALGKLHEALYGKIPLRKRLVDSVVGMVFLAFVITVLYYVSIGRHSMTVGSGLLRGAEAGVTTPVGSMSTSAFFWLALTLTLGAAVLTHYAGLRRRERREVQEKIRVWIAEQKKQNEGRERAEELISNVEQERGNLERIREEARERLRMLNLKAQEIERRLREDYQRRAKYAWAFVHALEAALRKDLHYFSIFNGPGGASAAGKQADDPEGKMIPARSPIPGWDDETDVPTTIHSIEGEVRS